jgi:GT2 family glycosyltransferase
MARATGEICGWLNSDDTLEPGALRRVAEIFAEHPDWKVAVGGSRCLDETGRTIDLRTRAACNGDPRAETIRWCPHEKGRDCFTFWSRDWFSQPSTFWRRELWERVGGLDERWNYSMDYDLWRRMAVHSEIHPVKDVFAAYRFHASAKCALDTWGPLHEVIDINKEQMTDAEFRNFSIQAMEFLTAQLESQESRARYALDQLEKMKRSVNWRVGSVALAPIRWIRRLA